MNKLIYVAGKYRADTKEGVEANIRHAERAAKRLWQEGWAVICPHLNTAHFDGDEDVFLEGGLEILSRCDAIYMLNGWQDSEGATKEFDLADELGLNIYFEELPTG